MLACCCLLAWCCTEGLEGLVCLLPPALHVHCVLPTTYFTSGTTPNNLLCLVLLRTSTSDRRQNPLAHTYCLTSAQTGGDYQNTKLPPSCLPIANLPRTNPPTTLSRRPSTSRSPPSLLLACRIAGPIPAQYSCRALLALLGLPARRVTLSSTARGTPRPP